MTKDIVFVINELLSKNVECIKKNNNSYPMNSCCRHSVWSHGQEMPLCRSVALAEEDHFLVLPLVKGMIAPSTLGQTSRTGLKVPDEDA